jgi:creatinine amidohydrolase
MSWKLVELTYAQVRQQRFEVAVIPLGAVEPHNYHLPYGNDFLATTRIAELACEKAARLGASVVLLPGLPYGVDKNLLAFPLTIHVSLFHLHGLLTDVLRSLERHQVPKAVLLNGHGGNTLKPSLREWYGDISVFVSVVDWWTVGHDCYAEIFACPDDHGGEMETSVALALYPELVRMEWADATRPRTACIQAIREGWAQISRPWHALTSSSGTADPSRATAEKGWRYVTLVTDRIAQYLTELSQARITAEFPYLPAGDPPQPAGAPER